MYQLENQIKQSMYDPKMTKFPFFVSFLMNGKNEELMELAEMRSFTFWFFNGFNEFGGPGFHG